MSTSYERLSTLPLTETALTSALDDYRLFEIKGPDALKFLQGQLTADLATLDVRGHSLTAHCNIKGHIYSLFRVFQISHEHYLASIHSSLAESGFNNLKKYSIFSKVELSFLEAWSGLAVNQATLTELNLQLLPDATDSLVVAQLSEDLFEIWAEDQTLARLIEEKLKAGSDRTHWDLALIRTGIPKIIAATQEHFIPQMVNLQALDGVSFSKGCYTGQEIVTRLQHRGILKKAMYRFVASGDDLPQAGSTVLDSEGVEVGEVVLAAPADPKHIELLAVIQQAQIDSKAPLFLPENRQLEQLDLPYTLDPKLFEKKR